MIYILLVLLFSYKTLSPTHRPIFEWAEYLGNKKYRVFLVENLILINKLNISTKER